MFISIKTFCQVSGPICNPSTQKAKTGGLKVQSQPGLHSETLSQKKKKSDKPFCVCVKTSKKKG
jgi:hypothetical protein